MISFVCVLTLSVLASELTLACKKRISRHTHIDVIILVSLVKVVHNGGLVQLSQCRHVLHSIDAGLVHGVHLLPGDLGLLQVKHLRCKDSQSPQVTENLYNNLLFFERF